MTRLICIRHGRTDWNDGGRLQGRADVPLNVAGQASLAGRRLPPELTAARWVASPLCRALESARLLGAAPVIESRIIEMDWGEWEGRTLAELRASLGEAGCANENRGLDFRPAGGESPRDVIVRLAPWLHEIGRQGLDTAAVSHKGVIRCILALAAGWDMTGRAPAKLDWQCAHAFDVDRTGRPRVERLNVPLVSEAA
ncbi:MAG: histidine phosphatase family protein [Alphaproteobacteria bacterium]|nr:histidine phosphatase family protein [Alphaproteobacteria bacterium]